MEVRAEGDDDVAHVKAHKLAQQFLKEGAVPCSLPLSSLHTMQMARYESDLLVEQSTNPEHLPLPQRQELPRRSFEAID